MPSRREAMSMSRSIVNVASGRPAPRNDASGTVFVNTARTRMLAAGIAYAFGATRL